jgi:uncharacterized protein YbjT (DUF2867 family)
MTVMGREAILIGATGLVGSSLLQQLLEDERFSRVIVLARRTTGFANKKLEEHLIDFNRPSQWTHLVKGDVLFSALGTTLKKAGSREAQTRIDHTYQYEVAKAAAGNHVPVYVLVSAAMASADSRVFYSRIKGELERDIRKLPFRDVHILRPGMLSGNRRESRPGESAVLNIMKFFNRLGIAKKYRPVDASIVAKAMIYFSFATENGGIHTLSDIFKAGEKQ